MISPHFAGDSSSLLSFQGIHLSLSSEDVRKVKSLPPEKPKLSRYINFHTKGNLYQEKAILTKETSWLLLFYIPVIMKCGERFGSAIYVCTFLFPKTVLEATTYLFGVPFPSSLNRSGHVHHALNSIKLLSTLHSHRKRWLKESRATRHEEKKKTGLQIIQQTSCIWSAKATSSPLLLLPLQLVTAVTSVLSHLSQPPT